MALEVGAPPNGERFHQTCADRRVAVEVDHDGGRIEIPTFEVETNVSKEGVSAKNCYTEAFFPAEWYSQDVLSVIDAFDPTNQSSYDKASVYYQDTRSDDWFVVHRGYVRAVGGGKEPNRMRMWLGDPSDFCTAIPVSATYGPQTTIDQIFEDCANTFEQHTVFDDVTVGGIADETIIDAIGPEDAAVKRLESGPDSAVEEILGIPDLSDIAFPLRPARQLGERLGAATGEVLKASLSKSSRSFSPNRHTLNDVLDWICDVLGGQWYFEFDNESLVLVWEPRIRQQWFSDQHTSGGTTIDVIENDAILEISPINSLTINGQSRSSLEGIAKAPLKGYLPLTGKWPTATAVYEPLVSRTGQQLAPPHVESDVLTISGAENVARRKLKEYLLGSPIGDIRSYGAPSVEPYSRITSAPICDGQLDPSISVNALDFEVQRITHTKSAEREYETRLEVSIFVDESKISVDSRLTDGSPTEEETEESTEGPNDLAINLRGS